MKVFNKRFFEKWKRICKYLIKDLLKNEREYENILLEDLLKNEREYESFLLKICYKMKENMKVFH
jgi:hypothetical protein